MEVALVTVGDEVLAGDTVNTNANWLATELGDRGALVARILTVPDDRAVIADVVREYAAAFVRDHIEVATGPGDDGGE
jgi:nicotinamide-nucleotide amidase